MARSELLDTIKEFLFPGKFVRLSISPLDAGLTPNDGLEELVGRFEETFEDPDDLAVDSDGAVYVTSGRDVVKFAAGAPGQRSILATLPGEVGPIACEPSGSLIVGVAGTGLVRVGPDGSVVTLAGHVANEAIHCPTDIAIASDGTIYVTDGSSAHHGDEWVHDLMEQNALGRLIRLDPTSGQGEVLRSGLAYPSGVTLSGDETHIVVCEAWAHRISSFDRDGSHVATVRENFPGYPGRISTAEDGTYWLAVFALRTQLVDFVLNQRDYVTEMMATIEPDYWIRPALRSLNSGLEPLQGGQIRKLGVVKPWAPPRSYGLAVHLDSEGHPIASWHSRGGGARHGVTSVRRFGTSLGLVIRGGRQVVITPEGTLS